WPPAIRPASSFRPARPTTDCAGSCRRTVGSSWSCGPRDTPARRSARRWGGANAPCSASWKSSRAVPGSRIDAMRQTRSGPTWDEVSSPGISFAVRRFESDWRSSPGRRPTPRDYLPDDPEGRPAALLALLRADLMLRWEADERRPVEWYSQQFPELDDDAV